MENTMQSSSPNKFLKFLKDNFLVMIIGFILALYVVIMIFCLIWGFRVSFTPVDPDFSNNPFAFGSRFTLDNWIDTFTKFCILVNNRNVYFEELILNSLIYSIGCTLVHTTVVMLVAYLVAKYPCWLSSVLYTTVIITMIIPVVGSLASEMAVVRGMGLYDNLLGVFFMKCHFLGMYFLIFYGVFKSLSWGYAEAAFIDGAGHFQVMVRIMFPLVINTYLAVAILFFIQYWNEYTTAMLYLPSYPTIAYALVRLRTASGSGLNEVPQFFAACMMSCLPILILFVSFQKQLMGDLKVGGLKG
ncbi:MAG: carbohydrate ABC transporter permease [Clostridia bacterium]|nr:carbohydrate ABC transporter permease [Clostridia bacterium]